MTAPKQTPTVQELHNMVRTAGELSAARRYQELAASREDVPANTLRELAEHMTARETVEQLTGTVDRILADGTHSEQRPGVLYKVFEEDPKEGLPRVTIVRDSMTGDDGQGDHLKVSLDYPHVSAVEGTALTNTDYIGEDFEWRPAVSTSVQHFDRHGETEPYADPAGGIRFRAADATHRGEQVFNDMTVREINSRSIKDKLSILELAELLRRREEGRERTKSQINAEIDANMDERRATEKRRRNIGRRAMNAVRRAFGSGRK